MSKQYFDIDESLRLSPPKYGKGVRFIKRIVLNRNDVTYSKQHQVRVLAIEESKITEIRDSFDVRGWVHNQPVPTIKVDPTNKSRFTGTSGWHRNAAANSAGWETMIYDVLEFDSPRAERVHMNSTNPAGLPFVPVTKQDLVKQIKEAVNNKEILNDDVDIKLFIREIASHQTDKYHDNIYANFRQHMSHSATLLVYRCVGNDDGTTKSYSETFNLPFKGDSRFNQTKQLGFITSESSPKTALYTAKLLYKDYAGVKTKFFGFIDKPIENPKLNDQRKKFLEEFNDFILKDCLATQFHLEQLGYDVDINKILKSHPVVFAGFLHQDISPDAMNDGKPLEYGIVDVNGKQVDLITTSNTYDIDKQNQILNSGSQISENLIDILNT